MRFWICAAALLIGTSPAAGQRTGSATEGDVRGVLNQFLDALEAGDARAFIQTVHVSTGSRRQEEGRAALAQLLEATKRLEKAAADRFGPEGGRLRCGFDAIRSPADRKGLAEARLSSEDDARGIFLTREGETRGIRFRRGADGKWRVTLAVVEELEDDSNFARPQIGRASPSGVRLDRYRNLAQAVNDVAVEIAAGRLPSAAAAEVDLLERVRRIAAETARRMGDRAE